jgi:3-phosphoshikimate 1-carboxyvinyltransferase
MSKDEPRSLTPISRIRGTLRVPGDKSISHRSLMFGAIAEGRSRIRGLSPGGDVRSTRRIMEALGVPIRDEEDGIVIEGEGWSSLDRQADSEPETLDCGNAGTTARLLCGLLSGRKGRYRLVGDESLSGRPMGRVKKPLESMGARFEGGDTLPLVIVGSPMRCTTMQTAVPSAQVKSALILAALQAEGTSHISEARGSRDHTERLLQSMGAPIEAEDEARLAWKVGGGSPSLAPLDLQVPGDPSSSAYAVALACLLEGSDLVVEDVSLNPARTGFYRLLQRMGADLAWEMAAETPEPIGTIHAKSGPLQGITVGPGDVVSTIDELPLLAVVAAAAGGETVISGAAELRLKESDRIASTVRLLQAFGAEVEERPDGMKVAGSTTFRGAEVDSEGDHRIAMCARVAAGISRKPSRLTGHHWAAISYPGFYDDLDRLAHS